MMEKLAQAGEVGVERPSPITPITYKIAVNAPAERADTLDLYFISIPIYSVGHIVFLQINFAVLGQIVHSVIVMDVIECTGGGAML
jgi:hypothetical protein